MNLYPAIDLFEGQVVRLAKGDFKKKTVYSNDPAEMAETWETQGALWIHVVDLEGAKTGVLKNLDSLLKIRKAVSCKIQFGGGVRSADTIRELIDAGINRVVLGTKALDQSFFTKVIQEFKDKIAVGLDARDGRVQTQGWLEAGKETLEEALKKFNDYPLETVIFTDIQRDGMLQGPNFEELEKVLGWSRASVILSGGVTSLDDIKKCRAMRKKNLEGAIIGKALYDKKFTLPDALAIIQ